MGNNLNEDAFYIGLVILLVYDQSKLISKKDIYSVPLLPLLYK
jgi:hypothetical protein